MPDLSDQHTQPPKESGICLRVELPGSEWSKASCPLPKYIGLFFYLLANRMHTEWFRLDIWPQKRLGLSSGSLFCWRFPRRVGWEEKDEAVFLCGYVDVALRR
jgi:hypothetical protein